MPDFASTAALIVVVMTGVPMTDATTSGVSVSTRTNDRGRFRVGSSCTRIDPGGDCNRGPAPAVAANAARPTIGAKTDCGEPEPTAAIAAETAPAVEDA